MIKLISTAAVATVLGLAANAETLTWSTELNGSNEVPSTSIDDQEGGTSATGIAQFEYNTETNILSWNPSVRADGTNGDADAGVHWFDLQGEVEAAHLHFGNSGENGPVFVDLFADAKDSIRDNTGFVYASTTLTEEQETEFLSNGVYVNVHTGVFPSGEIRGQLFEAGEAVSPVPVPAGLPLALTGLAALGFVARRRK